MSEIIIKVDYCDNFVATPANGSIACVVTADTFVKLKAEMERSLREHIKWMKEDGDTVPEEFAAASWEFKWDMSVRAILHHTEISTSHHRDFLPLTIPPKKACKSITQNVQAPPKKPNPVAPRPKKSPHYSDY